MLIAVSPLILSDCTLAAADLALLDLVNISVAARDHDAILDVERALYGEEHRHGW